jgi:uncharacterized protein (TIRG00374 family)
MKMALIRWLVTLAVLAVMLVIVSPGNSIKALRACDWRWLLPAIGLMPLFLLARVLKWYLLVRQVADDVRFVPMIPGYLQAMALGLITPGRLGEVSRAWTIKATKHGVGLFFLEKALEAGCLAALCLLSLATLDVLPTWVLVVLGCALVTVAVAWKRAIRWLGRSANRVFGRPSEQALTEFEWALGSLKVGGCALLSVFCLIVFMVQAYLLFHSMGADPPIRVMRFLPIVLIGNWAPVTVGGFGVREAIAVFLMRLDRMPEAVVLNSILLVTLVDLVILPFLAIGLKALRLPGGRSARETPAKTTQAESVPGKV